MKGHYYHDLAVQTPVQSQENPLPRGCKAQGGVCLCAHLLCNRHLGMMRVSEIMKF